MSHNLLYQVSERMTREGIHNYGAYLLQDGERWEFAMPLLLRSDFDAARLRAVAKTTKDGPQARRLLSLAPIYDGGMKQSRIGRPATPASARMPQRPEQPSVK